MLLYQPTLQHQDQHHYFTRAQHHLLKLFLQSGSRSITAQSILVFVIKHVNLVEIIIIKLMNLENRPSSR